MPLSPGDKLGPYEIMAPIGKGGMGEVYRAHDPRLGRDVAIKVSSQRYDERFEREARAIAALNHPNICHIYDVGPDYLVMELIEGPTLKERIGEGAIPLDEALRIAEQIAEALAAAHEKFIVHRDLKPGNVKIKSDGTVKVLDFGLAKVGGTPAARDSEDSPTFSMTLTQTGVILGTAAYMSPEQARGKPVDARADIWAFGVVLYEMLTARRLFRGTDLTETLASVVKEEPDLSAVPRKVRPLLEACLHKDPRNRLQAIGDRHFLLIEPEQVAGQAPAFPQRKRHSWLWPAIAGAFALVAAVLAWTHFRETPPLVQSLRYQLTRSGDFFEFQLSPDGRHLVYVANQRLFVRGLDSLEEGEIPGTDGATYPFWSPDGTHIAFYSQGKLKQVAFSGGPPTNIADAPDARGGTWGSDGTIVFAPSLSGGLFKVSPVTGGPATPLKLPVAEKDSLRFPAFLADSNRFFYVYLDQGGPHPEAPGLYIGSLDGSPPVRIVADQSTARFVPSPGSRTTGHVLFARGETLMALPFDAAALKATGEAFPLADGITYSGNQSNAAFTVSSNGTLLYLAGAFGAQEREIAWLDRTGRRGKTLLKQRGIASFALSPDGTQVAYSAVGGDVWLHDVAHGTSQRFTFGPSAATWPEWSPDSSAVVFTTMPDFQLYRKSTQTSAKEETLPVVGPNSAVSSWRSDGKLLVYSQTGDSTKDDLWLLPLDGDGKPKLFKQTPFQENSGQISPDGRWLVYNSDASGRDEIYIELMPSGSAPRQISVGGGRSAVWRKDGRELYFVSGEKLMAVEVTPGPDLTFGTPRELFSSNLIGYSHQRAVYPNADGSQFLALLPAGNAPTALPLTVVTNWLKAFGK